MLKDWQKNTYITVSEKSVLNMHNNYFDFELLHILHVCVDTYVLCFNTK